MNDDTTRPQVLYSQIVLDAFIRIRKERLLHKGSVESDHFTISSTPESVAVIAVNHRGEILVTQEYRHAIGRTVLGCPGGIVDPAETVLQAAQRELLEETGCTAEKFDIMGSCFPLPSLLDQKMTCILATGAHPLRSPELEVTETIHFSFLPKDELIQKLHHENSLDGILCTALMFFLLK